MRAGSRPGIGGSTVSSAFVRSNLQPLASVGKRLNVGKRRQEEATTEGLELGLSGSLRKGKEPALTPQMLSSREQERPLKIL